MQSLAQKQPTKHREKVAPSIGCNRGPLRSKLATCVKPSLFDVGKDGDSKVKKAVRKPAHKGSAEIDDNGTVVLGQDGSKQNLTEAGEELNLRCINVGRTDCKQENFAEHLGNLNVVLASTALSSVYIPPLRRVNATYFGDEASLQSSPEVCSSISQNADMSPCLSETKKRMNYQYQKQHQSEEPSQVLIPIDTVLKQPENFEAGLPLDANNAGVAILPEHTELLKVPKSFSRRVICALRTLKTKRPILSRKKSKEHSSPPRKDPENEASVPGSELVSVDSSSLVTSTHQCWSTATQADKPHLRETVIEMMGVTSPAFTAEQMNNFCDSTDWGKYPGVETECGLSHYPAMLNTMSNSNDSGKHKTADGCTKAKVLLAHNYRPGTDLFHQFGQERKLRRTD